MTWLLLLGWSALGVRLAWAFAAFSLWAHRQFGKDVAPYLSWLYHELRPFYLPALGIHAATCAIAGVPLWFVAIDVALAVKVWRDLRDIDDDDRWKRRRHKAVEKVAEVGRRLTVVPAGGAA